MRDFPGGPVVKTLPSNAWGAGSIPGGVDNIPHASGPTNQNIKQKQYCNKLNKGFKNNPHQKIRKPTYCVSWFQTTRVKTTER